MKLYTFMGNSPAEALKKAQEVCGKDALVISTKLLKKKSITSPALHEVVVALENKDKKEDLTKQVDKNVFLDLSNQAKELSKKVELSKQELSKTQKHLESDNILESSLKKDIELLNEKLDSIASMVWESKKSQRSDLVIPPEFADIYTIAKNSGMAKEHLEELMRATIKQMPTYMKRSPSTVKRYFQVLLKKMIPIRDESLFLDGSKKRLILVGPTGVGKTTTLAKLAARYSFLEHSFRVGIITLDSYRIGAVEQLYTYAKMLKLPIESALDHNDFKKALDRLEYCDIILIDTIGNSPYDTQKLRKLKSILSDTECKIDTALVTSATTKLNDLREIYQNFSILDLDSLIVTKFDESKDFGNIFSLTQDSNLPLSYFGIGQEVPDDLSVATSDFLIDSILGDFKKKSSDGQES